MREEEAQSQNAAQVQQFDTGSDVSSLTSAGLFSTLNSLASQVCLSDLPQVPPKFLLMLL